MKKDFLWVEAHRPKTIEECILPKALKETLQTFVDKGEIPNLLLTGGPGVGKTSVAKAALEQIGCDYVIINGSMNGNIDTLRTDIKNFASTVSFTSSRKYVILDEADYLNPNSTQPALRNFMEEFSKNCGFILTCNFVNRIIEPLHSRCSVINFTISKTDMPKLAAQFFKRVTSILEAEGIEYDKAVVAHLIEKYFPDWRRVINELQRYSAVGKIDSGILTTFKETSIRELVKLLKEKNFTEMRNWVYNNLDNEPNTFYRYFYDNAKEFLKPQSIPALVLTIADYQYKQAFVADIEINFVAFLTEVMRNCEFV